MLSNGNTNELIRVTESNGQKIVSARDLHEFLEVGRDFTTWCKQMFEYGFIEGKEFTPISGKTYSEKGGRPSVDYALTLDCSKEIAMIQRSEKGKQARQYFIEVEKKFKQNSVIDFSNPNTILQLAQNWAEEQNKRIAAEKTIKMLQPKADLMDKVLDADEKIDIGQAAKILELPFGRNTMFEKLREMGIFFKNRNEPKQIYIEKGYFQLKEKFIERSNHEGFVVIKVLVTQKGLEFLSNLFKANPQTKLMAKVG